MRYVLLHRAWMMFCIVNVFLLLPVLRILQTLRRRELNHSTNLVDYGQLSTEAACNVGLLERLGHFSFWNSLAFLIAGCCILKAVDELPRVGSRIRYRALTLNRATALLWLGLAFCYVGIYFVRIAATKGEFHGTFLAETTDPLIRVIQRSEGVVNVLSTLGASLFAATAIYLVAAIRRKTNFAAPAFEPFRSSMTWLLRAGSMPTMLCWPAYLVISRAFAGREFFPDTKPITESLDLGATVLPVLIWYGPFIAIIAVVYFTLRAPYSVAILKIQPPFFDISIKRDEQT